MNTDKVNDAVWDLFNSLRETNEAIANSALAAQERNLKFAQSTLTNGIELFKSNLDNSQTVTQNLVAQSQQQRQAVQQIVRESVDNYLDFLYAPLSFYQQVFDTLGSTTQQGLDRFQNVTRQGVENIQSASRQGVESMQNATRQAQNSIQRATK